MATGLFIFLLLLASVAHAAPPDFTSLISAFDMSTVSAALLYAGGVLIGVYILRKGAWMVIAAFADIQSQREFNDEYEDENRRHPGYDS